MTAPHRHRPAGTSRLSLLTPRQRGLMLRMARANRTTAEIAEAVGLPSARGVGVMIYHLRRMAKMAPGANGPTKARAGESDSDLIARHLAEKGVTLCPKGWAQGSKILYAVDMVV